LKWFLQKINWPIGLAFDFERNFAVTFHKIRDSGDCKIFNKVKHALLGVFIKIKNKRMKKEMIKAQSIFGRGFLRQRSLIREKFQIFWENVNLNSKAEFYSLFMIEETKKLLCWTIKFSHVKKWRFQLSIKINTLFQGWESQIFFRRLFVQISKGRLTFFFAIFTSGSSKSL